jgi:putative hydrolase of the HAD superfamily
VEGRAQIPVSGRPVVRAVLFDLFHTLTAREEDWADLPWTSDHLGIPRCEWYRALTQRSRDRLVGLVADPVDIVRRVADAVRPGLPDELIAEAAAYRVERFSRALCAIPRDTIEVLRELRRRGLKLGLVSNCDRSEMRAWPSSPLKGCFDAEVFSCEVGHVKPEPEIYRECLRLLDVRAEESLFVGDGGSDELRGAHEAGIRPVLYSGVIAAMWPDRVRDLSSQAEHHISRLDELLAIVAA